MSRSTKIRSGIKTKNSIKPKNELKNIKKTKKKQKNYKKSVQIVPQTKIDTTLLFVVFRYFVVKGIK